MQNSIKDIKMIAEIITSCTFSLRMIYAIATQKAIAVIMVKNMKNVKYNSGGINKITIVLLCWI